MSIIEIDSWTNLKSLIDSDPYLKYDHAILSDINQICVRASQSNNITYQTWIDIYSSDYNDYMNNYASGVSRGIDDSTSVSVNFSSDSLDTLSSVHMNDPHIVFDFNQVFNNGSFIWENIINGGSTTYLNNESSTRLSCTTVSGDRVIRQTKEYFKSLSGSLLRVKMSCVFGNNKLNVRKRVGYFDSNNGVFFEQTNDGFYFVIRSNVSGSIVDTRTERSNWTIDSFDGSGPSSITLDVSKLQTLVIDIQWIDGFKVRAGFVIDGILYYATAHSYSNELDKVYTRSINLPLRYEIENTGSSPSNTSIYHVADRIEIIGGYSDNGIIRTVSTYETKSNVGKKYAPLLAIRLKDAYKRAQLIPLSIKIFNEKNKSINVRLLLGASLSGGTSWESLGDNSICEYDVSSNSYSGGEIIHDWFVGNYHISGNIEEIIQPGTPTKSTWKVLSNYAGERDILLLIAKIDKSTSIVNASLIFKEII